VEGIVFSVFLIALISVLYTLNVYGCNGAVILINCKKGLGMTKYFCDNCGKEVQATGRVIKRLENIKVEIIHCWKEV